MASHKTQILGLSELRLASGTSFVSSNMTLTPFKLKEFKFYLTNPTKLTRKCPPLIYFDKVISRVDVRLSTLRSGHPKLVRLGVILTLYISQVDVGLSHTPLALSTRYLKCEFCRIGHLQVVL